MAPARVHQETPTIVRDGDAEMVGDRLVPAEPRGPAKRRRQIDARLSLGRVEFLYPSGRSGKSGHRRDLQALYPSSRQ
jgi:hypothetical protein